MREQKERKRRPTIANIAEIAGVSRGTVDRALNDRPGVNQEVAEMVRKIAGDLGYAPNRAAKALRFNHDPKRIGVILPVASSEFFGDIVDGIHRAEEELHDMGIETEISIIDCTDDSVVAGTLERLAEEGVAGVIATGPDTARVREAIDTLSEGGIPVVTINSDIRDCKRLCFVGQDLRKSGVVAAELMAKLVTGPGRVLAVTGNLQFQAHKDRIVGFRAGIERWGKALEVDVREGFDSYGRTSECIDKAYLKAAEEETEIVGVYMATGSIDACVDTLRRKNPRVRPRVVTNDVIPTVRTCLVSGEIDFTIFQDPVHQGYAPVKIIYDYLLTKEPPKSSWDQSPIRIMGASEIE